LLLCLASPRLPIATWGDLSSLGQLYNEIKFVRGVAHVAYNSYFPTIASGVTSGIVVYDPVSVTALTTFTNGMPFPHKTFFTSNITTSAGAFLTSAVTMSKNGYHSFKFAPLSREPTITNSNVVTNTWVSLFDSSTVFGYLKPYFQFDSSTNGSSFEIIIGGVFDVRQRN